MAILLFDLDLWYSKVMCSETTIGDKLYFKYKYEKNKQIWLICYCHNISIGYKNIGIIFDVMVVK